MFSQCFLDAFSGAEDEHENPKRRGDIGHDAHHQVETVYKMQSRCEKQARMLDIAFAPSAVSGGIADERGREFFVTATQFAGEEYFPAGASHEGGFDEVVAEDGTAERLFAGKL